MWAFLLLGCASFNGPARDPSSVPLKELAKNKRILFGSAVDSNLLIDEKKYSDFVRREFSVVVPVDETKFKSLQPSKNQFDFSRMEKIIHFARSNGLKVRGFAPVWQNPKALPDWLKNGQYSPEQLRKILKEHVQTVISHFKNDHDVIVCWEVANEVYNHKGKFKDSIWSVIEPDPKKFLKLVFTWAHEADPQAKLFYNDDGYGFSGQKSTAVYKAIGDLKGMGVPIHGVGFQMHLGWNETFDLSDLKSNFRKFADLGLEIHITEFDVALNDLDKSAEVLEKQKQSYFDVVSACLAEPACKAIVTWGFTDKYSWIPAFKPGFGRATFLDENYEPKPAYEGIQKALSQ